MQPPRDDFRMNLMLADHAQAEGGKLFVSGGGLGVLFQIAPGHPISVAIAGTIVVPFMELHKQHKLSIDLCDAETNEGVVVNSNDGRAFHVEAQLNAGIAPFLPRGTPANAPVALNVIAPLPIGSYYFRVSIADVQIKLPFLVMAAQRSSFANAS